MLCVAPKPGRFQGSNPRINQGVVLTNRALNPVDEGFDVAVRVFGRSFAGVQTVRSICFSARLCTAPGYLANRGAPSA